MLQELIMKSNFLAKQLECPRLDGGKWTCTWPRQAVTSAAEAERLGAKGCCAHRPSRCVRDRRDAGRPASGTGGGRPRPPRRCDGRGTFARPGRQLVLRTAFDAVDSLADTQLPVPTQRIHGDLAPRSGAAGTQKLNRLTSGQLSHRSPAAGPSTRRCATSPGCCDRSTTRPDTRSSTRLTRSSPIVPNGAGRAQPGRPIALGAWIKRGSDPGGCILLRGFEADKGRSTRPGICTTWLGIPLASLTPLHRY